MTAEKSTEGEKCAHEDHTMPTFSALSLEEGFSENVKSDISMTTDRIAEDGTYFHVGCTTPTSGDASARVQDEENSPESTLCKLRLANESNVIIGHLNVNYLQNKFEALKHIIQGKMDVLVLSETKIDDSFPLNQFLIEGFGIPFRVDRNAHGGGLIVYIREEIPCKELNRRNIPKDIEGIFIELNINRNKWFLMGGCNPSKDSISYFLSHISKVMDANLSDYENIILIGDFNAVNSDVALTDFCSMYNLKNLITEPTCYKNAENPTSIDVILTNRFRSFRESRTIETALSDYHKMIYTILKLDIKKKDPLLINYRSYKHFDDLAFRTDLKNELQSLEINWTYDDFEDVFMKVLNKHAPMKKKYVRGNNAPFMNQTLTKAFMHRSKLKNKYNKNPTEENKRVYNQHRNYCVSLLKKEKKKYYNNLDLTIFKDNKKFWQRVRPLFSDKQKALPRDIILIENDVIISEKKDVAEKLNNFFIEAVGDLNIEAYLPTYTGHIESTEDTVSDDIQVIINKYENHPSIIKIKENVSEGNNFTFKDITPQVFEREILKLDPKKATPQNDIPIKILVKSYDIISKHLSDCYNKSKNQKDYPTSLKLADVTPVHKKDEKTLATNYRPVSLIPVASKLFERNMYNEIIKFVETSLSPYLFGSERGTAPNIAW